MADIAETTRRIKSLLTVATYYLLLATGLANEPRTHGEIWGAIASGKPKKRDIQALIWSAHLVSASLRLAALEELLLDKGANLRKRAYKTFARQFIHVYLRDQTAHPAEEEDYTRHWRIRKTGLQKLRLCKAFDSMKLVRARLATEIRERHRSTGDLAHWVTSDLERWLQMAE